MYRCISVIQGVRHETEEKNNPYTVFVVSVKITFNQRDKDWLIEKRFREFSNLHDALTRKFSSLPPFPPKTWSKRFDHEFVQDRKDRLQTYLSEICTRPAVLNTAIFQKFFGIEENGPALGWQPMATPRIGSCNEITEIHTRPPTVHPEYGVRFAVHATLFLPIPVVIRANRGPGADGVTDADVEVAPEEEDEKKEQRGSHLIALPSTDYLLITACGDNSVVSRLDTYLNQFRFPWETAPLKLYNGSINVWSMKALPVGADMSLADLGAEVKADEAARVECGQKTCCILLEAQATAIVFHPRTRKLYVGTSDGHIGCFTLDYRTKELTLSSMLAHAHLDHITSLQIDTTHNRLLAVGHDKFVSIYNLENNQFLGSSTRLPSFITCSQYFPPAQRLFVGTYGQKICEFSCDQAPATLANESVGHAGSVRCMELVSAQKVMYSGGFDNAICVWSFQYDSYKNITVKLTDKWQSPAADLKIKSLRWCASISLLAVGGDCGLLHLWDTALGKPIFLWQAHQSAITTLVWMDASRCLLSGSLDGSCHVWDLSSFSDLFFVPH